MVVSVVSPHEADGERSTESFAKKKEADLRRREKVQVAYVEEARTSAWSPLAERVKEALCSPS